MAKNEVIIILKKYLNLLKENGISVDKAFLYGSYSIDKQNNDSDIDVMIVIKNKNFDFDFLSGKIWSLTRKINTKIEPYIVDNIQFKKAYSPLIEKIKKDGIIIN